MYYLISYSLSVSLMLFVAPNWRYWSPLLVGFIYTFWSSLSSTSSILEEGFKCIHNLQMTSSERFQQHFSIISKFVFCGFYMRKNAAFTFISFAVLKWMFISSTAIWVTGSYTSSVASRARSQLTRSKCEWTRIWTTYLHCCMKCPQILREKTSSQKYTVIALKIQWSSICRR